jgi:hypothetical protein
MGRSLCSVSGEAKKQKRIMCYSLGDSSPITAISETSEQIDRPSGTGPLFSYRGRDKGTLCPSLRTGLADFLHPALQLVVNFQEDRRAAACACFKENKPTAEKKIFGHRY